MNNPDDDFVDFTDEPATDGPVGPADAPQEASARKVWRVLIVDDDEDVHQATEFSLGGLRIHNRPLEFLHAHSSLEAIDILMDQKNVAVILLDVVMESEDAGLAAVSVIRRDLGLGNVQIILRTGQPGYAPEIDTIRRYDINDYRTKAELTRTKLYTAVTAGIRVYDHLTRLDSARKGLEQVALASSELISENHQEGFLAGMLRRAASILMTSQGGFLVSGATSDDQELRVKAATGDFVLAIDRPLAEIADESTRNSVARAFASQRTIIDDGGTTLFFPGGRQAGCAAHFPNSEDTPPVERQLLDVFCNVVAACRENLALVDELTSYAYVDPLTGLGSRRAFIRATEQQLEAEPNARGKISIALIDVDQFAEINDAFGHAYGDRLLLTIAARLRENLDADCFIARISNDIFGIVGKSEQVRSEALRPLFHLPFSIDGDERPISVSMAFVNAGEAEGGGVALLKDASIVVKRAKSGGFECTAHYTAAGGMEIRDRTRMLDQLRSGIREAELFLMYQPQIDLASGAVAGVEALMRWRNARGELIPPDRFIPVAEQSGLILQMGTWGLHTALDAALKIAQSGHHGIRVAVNVSAAQFRQRDLVDTVERALREHAVPPALLELEITESVALMGLDIVADQLAQLRQLGLAIAIDDFGTGYSSLSYLDRLPADRLKIDRAFVWALDADSGGARIAEMVVPLGRSLNMRVLAEGVETEGQAARLRRLGCDEVQGYLYARPMLLDDLLSWLAAR